MDSRLVMGWSYFSASRPACGSGRPWAPAPGGRGPRGGLPLRAAAGPPENGYLPGFPDLGPLLAGLLPALGLPGVPAGLAGLALRALSGIQGGSLPLVPRFFGGCVMSAMVHPQALLAPASDPGN